MTVRKGFKSAALFLTVGLVVLALTPGLAPADTYTVRAGGGSQDPWGGAQLLLPLLSPTPPRRPATPDGTAAAAALAGPGVVGSKGVEAYAYATSGPGAGVREANAHAEAIFFLTFTNTLNPTRSYSDNVSANLAMNGIINTTAAQAHVTYQFITPSGTSTLDIVNNSGSVVVTENLNAGSLFTPSSGVLSGTATTNPFSVLVNGGPQQFEMTINLSTFLGTGSTPNVDPSATCDFFDTFSFATIGDAFNLPVRVTVNGGFMVNNHYTNPFAPVPLPGTLPLLGSGLLGLVGFRLRRKK